MLGGCDGTCWCSLDCRQDSGGELDGMNGK